MHALILLAALSSAPPAAAADVEVRWRERAYALDALPAEMGEPAADAIAAWSGWADEHHYRLDLEDGGRVLLVSPSRSGAWRAQMRLVDRTVQRFELALPAPLRLVPKMPELPPAVPSGGTGPARPSNGSGGSGGGPLPEDPEGTPPGIGGSAGASTPSAGAKAAAPPPPKLDAETIVFFVVATEYDYTQLAARLAWDHPYLAGWAKTASKSTGFTLEQPLAGAYVASASGQQEWNPDNELVHRLAELLLIRRFGRVPYWIQQGWAWHLEEELLRGLYCFPYRDEFVFATEHTAWPNELERDFADHDGPVKIEELEFPRGRYDGVRARRAFGAVRFLVEHRRAKLGAALEALRVAKLERADGGEVPSEDQARLLRENAGDDVFDAMARRFRLGKAYAE